jgi:hypothetical protein
MSHNFKRNEDVTTNGKDVTILRVKVVANFGFYHTNHIVGVTVMRAGISSCIGPTPKRIVYYVTAA